MLAKEFTPDQFYAHLDWPVQWGDQDMFGHVNNMVYFRWFESARIKFLEQLGLARLHDPTRRARADFGARGLQLPPAIGISRHDQDRQPRGAHGQHELHAGARACGATRTPWRWRPTARR